MSYRGRRSDGSLRREGLDRAGDGDGEASNIDRRRGKSEGEGRGQASPRIATGRCGTRARSFNRWGHRGLWGLRRGLRRLGLVARIHQTQQRARQLDVATHEVVEHLGRRLRGDDRIGQLGERRLHRALNSSLKKNGVRLPQDLARTRGSSPRLPSWVSPGTPLVLMYAEAFHATRTGVGGVFFHVEDAQVF